MVTRDDELVPFVAAWDQMAVEQGRPFSSPAWLLPWWECVASPAGHQLRAVVVTEGPDVVGVFPFWVERTSTGLNHYRLMGCDVSAGAQPVVRGPALAEVVPLVLEQLLAAHPTLDVLRLEGVSGDMAWNDAVCRHWPLPTPWTELVREEPAPYVDFTGATFESWLTSKSTPFRKQMRRLQRRLEEQGFRSKLSVEFPEVLQRLPAFLALHQARWATRGGSGVIGDGAPAMLEQVAKGLDGTGRFQLWTIEREDGQVISADIMVGAGDELSSWLGGFDEAWSVQRPGFMNLYWAVERNWQDLKYQRLDLGAGAQDFKYEFSQGERSFEWWRIVRRGWRPVHSPAQFVPWPARRAIGRLAKGRASAPVR